MFRQLRQQIELTALETTADHVHDLRIILRRIEEAETPPSTKSPSKNSLREIFQAAGAVRDHDVTAELLAKSARSNAALNTRIAQERELAAGILREILTGPATRAALAALAEPILPAMPDNASALYVIGLAEDFFRRGQKACKVSRPKKLHRFRIAAKRFRYALDRLGFSGDPSLAQPLAQIQTTLGRLNDCRTALSLVNSESPKALRRWLTRRQRKYIARFQAVWLQIRPLKKSWLRVLAA